MLETKAHADDLHHVRVPSLPYVCLELIPVLCKWLQTVTEAREFQTQVEKLELLHWDAHAKFEAVLEHQECQLEFKDNLANMCGN